MNFDAKLYFRSDLDIPRIHRPTVEEFTQRFLHTQTPVIITGAMDDWPVLSKWTNAYLREKVGRHQVLISKSHEGVHFYKKDELFETKHMQLSDYIDQIESGELESKKLYAPQLSINGKLIEIKDDVIYPPYFDRALCETPNIWLGPGQNITPLHYDSIHNIFTQIRGDKTFLLFPPSEIKNLYPISWRYPVSHVSQINILKPDPQNFPKISKARCAHITLKPGEMLFLPIYWWHAVMGLGSNLSMNFWWPAPLQHRLRHPEQFLSTQWRMHLNAKRS